LDDYDRAVTALRHGDAAATRDLLLPLDRDARAYLLLGHRGGQPVTGEPADPALGHGRGVAQDYSAARTWYGRAAELGDSEAMDTLARMYLNGEGGISCRACGGTSPCSITATVTASTRPIRSSTG
jgi:TPR repeat protein